MNIDSITESPQVVVYYFEDDGSIPNNPTLPLLIYQGVLNLPQQNPAAAIESLLEANQWGNTWRNGIYAYHHYHSTAHEVLACYSGQVTVRMGGENGETLKINWGDVVIIPAGVGHKNLGSSGDFRVVGAYPPGQSWDLLTGKSGERPQALRNIARVPLPPTDPVYGQSGPLIEHWLKNS